jgi:molybdopterin molybdotransferase
MTARLLAVDDALAIVAAEVTALGSEQVAIADAHGRYLSEQLLAPFDLPPFTNSAMDGFAVRAAETPGTLRIIGESAAGLPFAGSLSAGEAVRISTGAVMPAGADAVAIVEQVSVDGDELCVPDAIAVDKHLRQAGSDTRRGSVVMAAGLRIGSAQIGAAAALGITHLSVGKRPTVAVIPTGSELTPAGQPLSAGAIYDSNGPMLQSLIAQSGGIPTLVAAPRDNADATRHALAQALSHDLVITTGGVSVGPHDIVREIQSELGVAELFWGVKLRPGKPLSFGMHGRTLVFGVPGNPVSTLVCFELFVRPALEALQGACDSRPRFQTRVLSQDVQPNSERDEMVRVVLTDDGRVTPLQGQMSHQLTVSAQAAGLIWIPLGDALLPAGSSVSYLPLRG